MTLKELYLRCVNFLYDTPIHIVCGSGDYMDKAIEIAVIKRSDFGSVFVSWNDFSDNVNIHYFETRGDNDSNYEVFIYVNKDEVKDNEIIQFFQNLRQNEKI